MRVRRVRSETDKVAARLRQLSRTVVTIGVHGDAPHPTDDDGKALPITMPELAAVHEFGAPERHIPERSFLRAAMAKDAQHILDDLRLKLDDVINGTMSPQKLATRGGVLILGAVREVISAGIRPELAEVTKASRDKKASHGGGLVANVGKYTPLVDSGQLWQSLVFRVDKRSARPQQGA